MVPLVSSSSSYHYIVYHDCRYYISWGRRGRDRMVVGFTPLNLWFRIPLRLGVLDTTLCDKVCQWLAAGRWFSPGTLVSPTNKTDRRDIAEILLKVALNSMTTLYFTFYIWFVAVLWSPYSVYFTFYICIVVPLLCIFHILHKICRCIVVPLLYIFHILHMICWCIVVPLLCIFHILHLICRCIVVPLLYIFSSVLSYVDFHLSYCTIYLVQFTSVLCIHFVTCCTIQSYWQYIVYF